MHASIPELKLEGLVHQSHSWLRCSRQAPIAALLVMAGVVGCRRVTEPPRRAERQPSGAERPQAARVFAFAPAPGFTVTNDSEPVSVLPEPTAEYSSLQQACRAVRKIMQGQLGVTVTLADSVAYDNEFVQAHRLGCELQATGKLSAQPDTAGSRSVDGDVGGGLEAAGWVDIPRYSADGPDGSSFGRRSRETVCLFRASWDGGDDSDSTYVPSDDWEVVGHCASREPGDSV